MFLSTLSPELQASQLRQGMKGLELSSRAAVSSNPWAIFIGGKHQRVASTGFRDTTLQQLAREPISEDLRRKIIGIIRDGDSKAISKLEVSQRVDELKAFKAIYKELFISGRSGTHQVEGIYGVQAKVSRHTNRRLSNRFTSQETRTWTKQDGSKVTMTVGARNKQYADSLDAHLKEFIARVDALKSPENAAAFLQQEVETGVVVPTKRINAMQKTTNPQVTKPQVLVETNKVVTSPQPVSALSHVTPAAVLTPSSSKPSVVALTEKTLDELTPVLTTNHRNSLPVQSQIHAGAVQPVVETRMASASVPNLSQNQGNEWVRQSDGRFVPGRTATAQLKIAEELGKSSFVPGTKQGYVNQAAK